MVIDHRNLSEDAPPRRRRGSLLWPLLLLVALAITMAGIFPFRQLIGQHRAVELTQAKLDALRAENDLLQAQTELLQTDAEIERIAREHFGYVREGEIGYVVEWLEPLEPTAPEPTLPPPDERAWYEKMWDWVTGREFQPDG